MIILNTEKLVKIKYNKKTRNGKFHFNADNAMYMYGYMSDTKFIIDEEYVANSNSYLEDGLFYYLPHIIFYSDDKSTETKYFKTNELALLFLDKIKQEPNLKTFTIE